MKKITFAIVWLVCFLLLLLVCDQFLLRYPGADTPMLSEFQSFYQDLRQRVLALEYHSQPHSVQQVISEHSTKKIVSKGQEDENGAQDETDIGRYIYVDENNTLNFADSLEQVPANLRASARKLDK
ncbi:MAG: hypothetical protein JW773_07100 [Desulfuromonadales bacterium]|nr:hypothetical protein [Desulfuromonadales bacterium]